MLLLKHTLVMVLALWLRGDKDMSLLLERAVPPAHPVNAAALGITTVEIELAKITGALDTRVLYGEGQFVMSAIHALKQWRFKVPAGAEVARTSVTFMFRPPAMYPLNPVATWVRPWMPGEDCPALPQRVIDPGYPPTSVASGAVILAAQIDAAGVVTGVETIRGIAPLTEQARIAVMDWKFSPAMASGRPVSSTAFVVISFMLPM